MLDKIIDFWPDILGGIGSFIIIVAYMSIQSGKMSSEKLSYSLVNGLGASLIIVSLYHNFNLSAFIIEFFWVLISLFGIYKYLFKKKFFE